MQNVMQIATNAGHTAQNDGRTAQNDGQTAQNDGQTTQNDGRTAQNGGRNTLNVCQGPKGGLEVPPGVLRDLLTPILEKTLVSRNDFYNVKIFTFFNPSLTVVVTMVP